MTRLFLIDELKKEGHDLLQTYIKFDPIKSKRKVSVARAYSKLNRHFSQLNTVPELLRTIKRLKSMIQLRVAKNEEKRNEQYAPNLRELQHGSHNNKRNTT
jgi:hypothetical protein